MTDLPTPTPIAEGWRDARPLLAAGVFHVIHGDQQLVIPTYEKAPGLRTYTLSSISGARAQWLRREGDQWVEAGELGPVGWSLWFAHLDAQVAQGTVDIADGADQ